MTIEEIDKELEQLAIQLKPLHEREDQLQRQKRECLAKSFITANKITNADVELSSGDGKPYFSVISQFVVWLRSQPANKRFAEWNETIYFTTDLLAGRMPPDMPATIRDLKE
mgnify:CR=1 FL=1